MFTFIEDDSGATALEYGIFVGLPFAFFAMISGNVLYKIGKALDILSSALV